jgi:hypothetical protein
VLLHDVVVAIMARYGRAVGSLAVAPKNVERASVLTLPDCAKTNLASRLILRFPGAAAYHNGTDQR